MTVTWFGLGLLYEWVRDVWEIWKGNSLQGVGQRPEIELLV